MTDYSQKYSQNYDELDDETLLMIYQELIDQGWNTNKTAKQLLAEYKSNRPETTEEIKQSMEDRWRKEKELELEFKKREFSKPTPGGLANEKDGMWEAVRQNGKHLLMDEKNIAGKIESWLAEKKKPLIGRDEPKAGKDPYDVYPLD